jgi:plasmid stability protein
MTITLDLPDDLVEDIRLRAVQEGRGFDEMIAELLRTGLATSARTATAVQATPSMLDERRRIASKFLTGEWGVELAGFEEGRAADRETAIGRMHDLRRGVRLDGENIRDLLDKGRRS